ncbi:MAG: ABC transporter ATP-binding protein [Lachnospiraceae bacterium]
MMMLHIENLEKSFGTKKVLDGISLDVPEHSIFGFVGKNGAGKTTTMKMVLGMLKPDRGNILVNGEPVIYGNAPTNRYIGYLPDVPEFYDYMTAGEYLQFCGSIIGMEKKLLNERSKEMLSLVGLANETHRIKGFSRGMKQRLGIAQALLHEPKLLICDEPTSALDPVGRKEIMDVLVAAKEKTTILFSTHILSDVERICDQLALLHNGKIMLSGSMEEIKTSHKNISDYDITISVKDLDENKLQQLKQYMAEHDIPISDIKEKEWNLEQLFMEVIGK